MVGVDFGTLSGRAVVVRVEDGAELGTATHEYPHGVLDQALPDGTPLGPGLGPPGAGGLRRRAAARGAARRSEAAGVDPAQVIGIATDFTACTMVPTTADGTPLYEVDGFASDPHAYVKLWKHHAAQPQADRINALAAKRGEAWLARYGGLISSEWEFAKGLQLLEEAPRRTPRWSSWVEAADWIVWQLCGSYVRNACTAGYKGIHQDGTYPTRDFLAELNPEFAGFVSDKLEPGLRQARRAWPAGSPPRRPPGPGFPKASWSRSATSTPTSPRPPPRPPSPARWSRSWAPRRATS